MDWIRQHTNQATIQMCFVKRLFWRFPENLQEIVRSGVLFNWNCRTPPRLFECCFSENIRLPFSRIITNRCFWVSYLNCLTFSIFMLAVISQQFSGPDLTLLRMGLSGAAHELGERAKSPRPSSLKSVIHIL